MLVIAEVQIAAGECFRGSSDPWRAAVLSVGTNILLLSSPTLKFGKPCLPRQKIDVFALREPEYDVVYPLRLACNEYKARPTLPACLACIKALN